MRTPAAALHLLVACAGTPRAPTASAPPPPGDGACAAAAHRGFDFWVGTWDVATPAGEVAGRNVIVRADRGCVLIERWTGARGSTGTSLNHVDPATGEWVQHWADSDGGAIELRGGLEGGAMVLRGTLVEPGPKRSLLRGRWSVEPDGRVRQRFEQSVDDGATWTVWFEGLYTRAGAAP